MSRLNANYVERLREELAAQLPHCEPAPINLYTLLALQYGQQVTGEAVHNAWSVWCNSGNPNHRSLVPYAQLPFAVRALDEPYVAVIQAAVAVVQLEDGVDQ